MAASAVVLNSFVLVDLSSPKLPVPHPPMAVMERTSSPSGVLGVEAAPARKEDQLVTRRVIIFLSTVNTEPCVPSKVAAMPRMFYQYVCLSMFGLFGPYVLSGDALSQPIA
jgi:hypothetical protein